MPSLVFLAQFPGLPVAVPAAGVRRVIRARRAVALARAGRAFATVEVPGSVTPNRSTASSSPQIGFDVDRGFPVTVARGNVLAPTRIHRQEGVGR
ncbi:hypothetical protein [Actinoplanes palleronii]|uniref:hypothetical protein n=1 Tax=Actinoplanes palleronii TaxID=113570 RepID=UPI001943ED50|nr:hypothetical protein [Actinoplanes palleronii]